MTEQKHKIYILYHAGCQDGLGSKYAAWKKFGDTAEYIPVSYGHPPPHMEDGSEVYIIDFSYDKATLEALDERMWILIVLDHHKTAEAALKELDFACFDMNKSGAVMAWNFFHSGKEVPEVLKRVQDRDLWRWQYKDTKPVTSALQTLGDNMYDWDHYVDNERGIEHLSTKGQAIEQYKASVIERICRPGTLTFRVWKGWKVAIVNATDLQSEIGAQLYDHYDVDFAIMYALSGAGLVYLGLRSKPGKGTDVSEVAKIYGGGGHKHSAGCTAPTSILHEWFSSTFFDPKKENNAPQS